MSQKSDRLTARFTLNMQRVAGLARLVISDGIVALKPTGFAQYEGPSADILRFVIVFLHATFEDVLRSHLHNPNKTITFSSGSDINKALKLSGIDTIPFLRLHRPLTQMAKRRNRIVHDADLPTATATVVEAWNITDYWQLCMWNFAVLVFYYQLLISTNVATGTQREFHKRTEDAMSTHVEFGHQLVAFANTPRERQLEALKKASETLALILTLLNTIS